MKYKVGDRFVVTKNNTCGYQVGAIITIEDVDSDERKSLPYTVDDWYLGDSTTIKDCEYDQQLRSISHYDIDTFAQYILDESTTEISKDTDCGHMVVKGRAYEDIVSILLSNGYAVQVSKDNQNDFNIAEFEISYRK